MAKRKVSLATGTKLEFVIAPLPFRRVALIAALGAAVLGAPALVLPGWMPPLVGAGLLCTGAALALFAAWPADKHARLLSMLAAMAVALYAGAFVLQSVAGGKLDVEAWMGPVPLGTISPVLTGTLFAAGLTLLWLIIATTERPRGAAGAGSLGAAIATLGLGLLLGQGYGLPSLRDALLPISTPAGVALLVLGLGLAAAAGPDQVPLSALSGPSTRARLLRVLAGAMIAALIGHVAVFQLALQKLNPAAVPLSSTLALVALTIATAAPLLSHIGARIDREQAERAPAAEADHGEDLRLHLIAAQLPLYVWTTDRDLRVTSVMGGLVDEADSRRGRWMGRTLYELFRSRQPEFPPIAAHLRALQGEPGHYEFIYQGHRQECRVQSLRDATGTIVGCLGVALDTSNSV
jgi:PAS domain-containing protein